MDDHLGWVRIPDSIFQESGFEDPSSGPTAAHIEMILGVSISFHALKETSLTNIRVGTNRRFLGRENPAQ
jgi:hypothetical protein